MSLVDPPSPHEPKTKASSNRNVKASKLRNKETEVLKHRNTTVFMPIVSRIAKNLFKGALEVAGSTDFNDKDEDVAAEIDNIQSHHSDPQSMQWILDDNGNDYAGVIMDGVTYQVSFLPQP